MVLETTGRDIASRSAAFAMLPSSATAMKTCRSRGLKSATDAGSPVHH